MRFLVIWMERNRIVFENQDHSIQKLKNYFVCSLWSWIKGFIDEGPLPLVNFLDWIGSR